MEHKEVSNKFRPKTAAQREGWVRKIRRQQQEKITRLQRRITELTTENIRLKKIVAICSQGGAWLYRRKLSAMQGGRR